MRRSMRDAIAEQSLAWAPGGPGGQSGCCARLPACPPARLPAGRPAPWPGLWALSGVGMFLKRGDPRGCALSATASVQEGWMMVGMAQRSWSPPEPLGRGGEGEGAVVTLHSGRSCRGTPRLHGSTAGTGPPSAPWPGAACAGSSRSGTCPPRPRSASAPGRCSA